ncbi:MAG: hypothetical protein M3063_09500 [Actinomycetota bacterium]|nr:hypothetical protein [Actinomycetota bacterium]
MPPAAKKAPLDYLFAIFVGLFVFGTSFVVDPPATRYIVMITGAVMLLAALGAAARPDKADSSTDGQGSRSTRS